MPSRTRPPSSPCSRGVRYEGKGPRYVQLGHADRQEGVHRHHLCTGLLGGYVPLGENIMRAAAAGGSGSEESSPSVGAALDSSSKPEPEPEMNIATWTTWSSCRGTSSRSIKNDSAQITWELGEFDPARLSNPFCLSNLSIRFKKVVKEDGMAAATFLHSRR